MNIKYKILSVDTSEHTIIVRFYTDIITEEKLASFKNPDGTPILDENGKIPKCRTDYNICIWAIPIPEGEELEKLILRHAPIDWLALQEQLLTSSVDMSNVMSLIDIEHTKVI